MGNTLTNLINDSYAALDAVSRELVGFIPSVYRDASVDRVAVGETLRIPISPASSAADITPAVTPPDDGDQTFTNATLTISKSRRVPFRWNGEESQAITRNSGPGRLTLQQDQIAQGMRTLANEIETDLAALHVNASRAYGDGGTTPFASTLADPANCRKILDDNGAPMDRSLVIDTTAGAALRTLGQVTKANEAGSDRTLRDGVLLDLHGFEIRESAKVANLVTSGTGSSATTDNAGYAIGATVITLAAAGTGTILAGDVIRFNGDANQYVVASGDADVSGGGTITLAAPGLRQALAGSATAITVEEASSRNMAFSRNSILLALRAPYKPAEGDSATDEFFVTDPVTGITFEISHYPQYRQSQYEIAASWGVSCIKPEHLALLLG